MKININTHWSCKCGHYRGIKLKDATCWKCSDRVIFRKNISFKTKVVNVLKNFFVEPNINKNIMKNNNSNGKGSLPRPFSISKQKFDNRWEIAFGKSRINKLLPKPPEEKKQISELKNGDVISMD